jgi:RNA methyltransferase, TrmH family
LHGQSPRNLSGRRRQAAPRVGAHVLISSRENEKLKLVRKLHDRRWRDKLGLFVAEGEDLVDAARAAGVEPVELLVAGENVEPALLAEVSTLAHPPRVIGVFRREDLPGGELPGGGLALWHVADPGNVGALLRSADALGPAFVALSDGCADPTGPKAVRASMGALFRVPLVRFDDALRPWIGLVAHGGTPLSELDLQEGTFVLGAEREGLPEEVVAHCDALVTIQLASGADSLNVAMAGTIALYEASRRRSSS